MQTGGLVYEPNYYSFIFLIQTVDLYCSQQIRHTSSERMASLLCGGQLPILPVSKLDPRLTSGCSFTFPAPSWHDELPGFN
jgi:hypothetical protein